jgi:hypothetical protein
MVSGTGIVSLVHRTRSSSSTSTKRHEVKNRSFSFRRHFPFFVLTAGSHLQYSTGSTVCVTDAFLVGAKMTYAIRPKCQYFQCWVNVLY